MLIDDESNTCDCTTHYLNKFLVVELWKLGVDNQELIQNTVLKTRISEYLKKKFT